MWRILFLVLILFSSTAFAQAPEKPKAILQDVTGRPGECDLGARLQNLYLSIADSPNSYGVIITYQGVNELPANYDSSLMYKRVKQQLKFLQYDEAKFKVISGGFRSEIEIEYWFVPQDADEPMISQNLPKPTIPTDKTFLYDESSFGSECFECGIMFELLSRSAQKEQLKLDKEFEEENKKNGVEEDDTEDEPTYTKDEIEEMKFAWAKSKFAEILKSQKDSIGTIIFYGDEKEYNLKAVRAHVEQGKMRIAKESQVSPNQIKIVYGGFRYSLEAEFWITPKGAKLPTPKPEIKEKDDSTQ